MAITAVQQGAIGQNEFFKLVTMGTGGMVEVAETRTDDDRRDAELHIRGQFGFELANQIKTTLRLHLSEGGSRYLECKFHIRQERIVNSPYFWYFVAYMDPELMRFADPVFFVPSTVMHAHTKDGRDGDERHFKFVANMEPNARDQWVQYRVNTLDLGKRVLQVMKELTEQQRRDGELSLSLPPSGPGVIWLRKAA